MGCSSAFKTYFLLFLLYSCTLGMSKEIKAQKRHANQAVTGIVKGVYNPFARLDFSYTVTFNYGQERDTNLQGATTLHDEYQWGDTVWSSGSSFALVDGHLVVINGTGTRFMQGRDTAYLVHSDINGKETVVSGSLTGNTQITAQNAYSSGPNLWGSGTFKVIDGHLVVVNGSFKGSGRGGAGLDFTYSGTSDENGKMTIDPTSLHGQTDIHERGAAGDLEWTSGTFKIVDGQLVVANGTFERRVWGFAGLDLVYGGASDENGKMTIDPASLHGQTVIHDKCVIDDDVWFSGTIMFVDGQLKVVNGSFERHASDAAGLEVAYRGTSDENGNTTMAIAPPPPASRFAGLYQAELPGPNAKIQGRYWGYLRLYSDGTVLAMETGGTGTADEVAKIAKWFHRPYKDFGTYQIQGTAIEMTVSTWKGTVHYQGQIEGTTLILDSVVSRTPQHSTYRLVLPGD